MAKTSVDLQPIDRLEEKIKQLVGMVDALRALGDAEGATAEATTLREERELIKTRVAQMISQIEKLGI